MPPRVSTPDPVDLTNVLDRRGIDHLLVHRTRAVVVFADAVVWVDTPEGALDLATEFEVTVVDSSGDDANVVVTRFERLLKRSTSTR
jgi:hypothetical protein